MINLLPEGAASEVKRLYKRRLFGTALIFLFLLVLESIFLQAPTVYIQDQRLSVARADLASALAKPISKQANDASELIKDTNNKLSIFHPQNQLSYIKIIDKIFSHKISGISLRSFDMNKEGGIKLAGVADTRTNLLTFIKSFERDTYFVGVQSPISNLITTVDIAFSIDFKLSSTTNYAKK